MGLFMPASVVIKKEGKQEKKGSKSPKEQLAQLLPSQRLA